MGLALELSTGYGLRSAEVRALAGTHEVIGFDVSPAYLSEAMQRTRHHTYVLGDAMQLPFADDALDMIVSEHTLEHVGNPYVMLDEISRVLRPGGRVVLAVPYPTSEYVKGFLNRNYLGKLHLHVFTPSFIHGQLECRGLSVLDYSQNGSFAALSNTIRMAIFQEVEQQTGRTAATALTRSSPYKALIAIKDKLKDAETVLANHSLLRWFFKATNSLYPFEMRFVAEKIG